MLISVGPSWQNNTWSAAARERERVCVYEIVE